LIDILVFHEILAICKLYYIREYIVKPVRLLLISKSPRKCRSRTKTTFVCAMHHFSEDHFTLTIECGQGAPSTNADWHRSERSAFGLAAMWNHFNYTWSLSLTDAVRLSAYPRCGELPVNWLKATGHSLLHHRALWTHLRATKCPYAMLRRIPSISKTISLSLMRAIQSNWRSGSTG
jgi:hypothetical protein